MRDLERISYAVKDPDKYVPPAWQKSRHPHKVRREVADGTTQVVTFLTPMMRDRFLTAQKKIAVPIRTIKERHRNSQYGAHRRHRHLVNR